MRHPLRAAALLAVPLAGLVAVLLVRPAGTADAPAARERHAAPTPLGMRTGFSPGSGILAVDRDELERELDLVVDSGAGWVRLDVDWAQVERVRGTRDWSRLDRVVGAALARDLQVLALVTYTPVWARPGGADSHHPPQDPAAFADFAGAAAARYAPQGVLAYEIWNEPNIPSFWTTGPDAAEYARLLVPASAAVRAAAPGATVLSGGLAPATDDAGGGQLDPRTFVAQLYAALAELAAVDAFDAVAVHPYSFPELPTGGSDFNTFGKLADVRATMVAQGDADKTIWLTELGAPTGTGPQAVSESLQQQLVVEAVQAARALPWVERVFVYASRDAGDDLDEREDNFGLLRRDFSPKPAYRALQDLLRAPGDPAEAPTGGAAGPGATAPAR